MVIVRCIALPSFWVGRVATVCARRWDPNAARWPYQQVAAQLREQIASGAVGPRLPSAMTLAEQMGVAPNTVQRAGCCASRLLNIPFMRVMVSNSIILSMESPVSDVRDADSWRKVAELARERPDWLPVLRAACEEAAESERLGGRFAGRWVLQRLTAQEEAAPHRPGLRLLVGYGLLEKSGESTRGGRRAYYRMPEWREVRQALDQLDAPHSAAHASQPLEQD